MQHGVHPDLTWVTPSGAQEMLVGDIDEPVVASASRTPFEARRRVFVIERAETMNEQSQNKMLKTLEEPASFAHLILLSSRPGKLLPTISSRCQLVRFDAPEPEAIAERLVADLGLDPAAADAARPARSRRRRPRPDGEPACAADAEAYARAALRGDLSERPWMAMLAEARKEGDRAQAAIEERVAVGARTAPQARPPPRASARAPRPPSARNGGRGWPRSTKALELTGLWFRDVACVAGGAADLVHATDRLGALEEDAKGRSAHRLWSAVALVDESRAAFILYPNEELLLEALASRLARAAPREDR